MQPDAHHQCSFVSPNSFIVVQISSQTIVPPQLVAITQHTNASPTARGPPLAVGHLAVDLGVVKDGGKGKAVHVLHSWKDYLFDLGSKVDPPGIVDAVDDATEGKEDLKPDSADGQDSLDADIKDVDGKDAGATDLESKVVSQTPPQTIRARSEPPLSKEGDLHLDFC